MGKSSAASVKIFTVAALFYLLWKRKPIQKTCILAANAAHFAEATNPCVQFETKIVGSF